MESELLLNVAADGTLQFVWDDRLAAFRELGELRIARASDVEPTPAGEWTADLGRMCGPRLGPFRMRQEALDAEREWLRQELGV